MELCSSAAAGRARQGVIALTLLLAAVTYLDRVCIGTLAPAIMRDLALSKEQMSAVFSAFALAYALFGMPAARWADRRGPRRVLACSVLWWSAFTMATGAAAGFVSLLITRFLFGLGEAGAWPCVAKAYSRWLAPDRRGRVQAVFFAAALLAGGVTPTIVVALAHRFAWRAVFVLCGTLGILWAASWWRWFRDDPPDRALVAGPSGEAPRGWAFWKHVLTHPNVVKLCLMYFPNSFVFYFCITWLPKYLEEQLGFHSTALGVYSGLPLVFATVGVLAGGVATDAASRRRGLRFGRSAVGAAGYLAAAAALFLAAWVHSPNAVALLFAAALAGSYFTLSAAWNTCLDIGGEHAGVVSAAMNTSGQIASILSPLVAVAVQDRYGSWDVLLVVMGAMFAFGAVCWALIDPGQKVFP